MRAYLAFPHSRALRSVFFLVVFLVPAVWAYSAHNLAWSFVGPVIFFSFLIVLASVLGILERVFGIGRRKGTPEEFARALEKHLLREPPEAGWDDPMDVVLADPRLELIRRRLGHNLDTLARDEDKDELRAVISALRRGDLPELPQRRGFADFLHLRR